MIQIMKFVVTMISILCFVYIIPIHSRHENSPYFSTHTVYRGVLGCNETVSGEVIYNGPDSPQAYESWTIPVKDCFVTISTCFDGDGDDISFAGFPAGDWELAGAAQGDCPAGGPGAGNAQQVNLNLIRFAGGAACDGTIDGLIVIRVGTVDDTGSGNYTLSLDCNADCTICPVDPELDTLQQIEDKKGVIDCDLYEEQCDSDSSDSSESMDNARSELEKVDGYDVQYQYEGEQGTDNDNNDEESYVLLKVAQSVWINIYSFLAVTIVSCGLLFICLNRRNKEY